MADGLSGLLSPLLTGVIVDRVSYTTVFYMVALMPLTGTALLFAVGAQYKRGGSASEVSATT